MDLLRYLIAPHERTQQQFQSVAAATQTQPDHGLEAGPESYTRRPQGRHTSAVRLSEEPSSHVLVHTRLGQNRTPTGNPEILSSSTYRSSASETASRDSYQYSARAPIHPEVLNFLARRRHEATGVASSSQAESTSTPAIRPEVLDFLQRRAPPSCEVVASAANASTTPSTSSQGEQPVLQQASISGPAVVYLPPLIVPARREGRGDSSTTHKSGATRSSEQSSMAGKLPAVMHTSHESTKAPNWNKICFFWYHYGDCTRDPNSATFNGSSTLCRFFHFIDAGMENVGLQKVPPKLHRDLGDCQLPRCPLSSNYDFRQYEASDNQPKAAVANVNRMWALAQVKKSNDVQGGPSSGKVAQVQMAQSQSTPAASTVTTNPAGKQKRRRKMSSAAKKDASAAGSTSSSAKLLAKRKASEISSEPAEKGPSKKKSRRKGQTLAASVRDKPSPSAPTVERRPFSIISATEPEPMPKTAVPTSSKQTCFFWYHGCCSYPGRKCEHLHALTKPPTFVQPPPNYVHRETCFRAWCPGDYMWNHGGEGAWHDEDENAERYCGDNVETDSGDEGETGSKDDDEWFASGFPDA